MTANDPLAMPTDRSAPDLRGMILDALHAVGGRDYLARQAIETPGSGAQRTRSGMATANSDGSATLRRRGPGRPFVKGQSVGRPFSKGASGNPAGRPKVVVEIRDLARQFGAAGIAKLAQMAGLADGLPAEAEAVRVAAIKELLDRGFGKSTVLLAGDSSAGPLLIDFRWADALPQQPSEAEAIEDAAGGIIVEFATETG